MRQRILADLDDDFTKKTQQILALEREIAGYLVQTPYVLLMAGTGTEKGATAGTLDDTS
jgi:hypothetical protein